MRSKTPLYRKPSVIREAHGYTLILREKDSLIEVWCDTMDRFPACLCYSMLQALWWAEMHRTAGATFPPQPNWYFSGLAPHSIRTLPAPCVRR